MSDRADPGAEMPAGTAMLSGILHAGFVLTGGVTTLLGPVLPILCVYWSLTDSQAGYFFTSQFSGSMAGVGLSSFVIPRLGYKRSLYLSFCLMSAGVGTLGHWSWHSGLLSVICYGIGLGLAIPTINLLVSDLHPTRRAEALNILNMAWGIGAVSCPALTAMILHSHRIQDLFLALAGLLCMVAIALACHPYGALQLSISAVNSANPRDQWSWCFTLTLALLFFLYVGTENVLSGWAAAYTRRLTGTAGAGWVLAPSLFWAALLLGRAVAPAILRGITEANLMLVGLLTAAFAICLVLAASTLALILLGLSLSGLGLASVFPIAVSALAWGYGAKATRIGGAMFVLGGAGGATIPWLVGFLSTRFGSLRLGLIVPLAAILIMTALQFSPCLTKVIDRPRQPLSADL